MNPLFIRGHIRTSVYLQTYIIKKKNTQSSGTMHQLTFKSKGCLHGRMRLKHKKEGNKLNYIRGSNQPNTGYK